MNAYDWNHLPGDVHPVDDPSLTCWWLTSSVYFAPQDSHWLTVPKAEVPALLFRAYLIWLEAPSGPNGLPILASSSLTLIWVTVSDDGPITKLPEFWVVSPLPYFPSISLITFIAECEIFQEFMQDIWTNAQFLLSPVKDSNRRVKDMGSN